MQAMLNWIAQLGFAKAEIKCDQEPSTVELMNALVARCRSTQLVPKASPKGSQGSLCRGERGHLSVQGQVRTLRSVTQEKYKITLDPQHVLMPWMCRHSSWIIERFQPRWSGHTAHHSMRGKDYSGIVLDFAETCQYRLADFSDKLNVRWAKGVFVGKLAETDEFLLITERGLIKARAVKRLSGEEAWDTAFLKLCKGSPWNPSGKIGEGRGERNRLEPGQSSPPYVHHERDDHEVRQDGRLPLLSRSPRCGSQRDLPCEDRKTHVGRRRSFPTARRTAADAGGTSAQKAKIGGRRC